VLYHPGEATPKAREFARKALSLDNTLGEPHATLGVTLTDYDFDFAGAEREFKRAIELNPNYATAHQWFAEMLGYAGRSEESFAEFRRALEIDPLSLPINWNYGKSLYYARRYDVSVLLAAGIRAVFAKSFARTFYRNAINNGLVPFECDTSRVHEADRLIVSLTEGVVLARNETTGEKLTGNPFPTIMLEILAAGGLVTYFKMHHDFLP